MCSHRAASALRHSHPQHCVTLILSIASLSSSALRHSHPQHCVTLILRIASLSSSALRHSHPQHCVTLILSIASLSSSALRHSHPQHCVTLILRIASLSSSALRHSHPPYCVTLIISIASLSSSALRHSHPPYCVTLTLRIASLSSSALRHSHPPHCVTLTLRIASLSPSALRHSHPPHCVTLIIRCAASSALILCPVIRWQRCTLQAHWALRALHSKWTSWRQDALTARQQEFSELSATFAWVAYAVRQAVGKWMLWSTVTSLQSLGTHAWEQQEMAKAMYQLYHQPPPCERLATSTQYWASHAAAKVLNGWRRTTSRDLALGSRSNRFVQCGGSCRGGSM